MKKILSIIPVLIFSLYSSADVNYLSLGTVNGDVSSDGLSADFDAVGISYTSATEKVVFGGSVSIGEMDVAGYNLDYVADSLSIGYGFTDISTGSFVIGASYSRVEMQFPGTSNLKTTSTDGYIGYYKISGEGVDYSITYEDSVLSANLTVPLGTSSWRARLGIANSDDGDSISIGVRYLF